MKIGSYFAVIVVVLVTVSILVPAVSSANPAGYFGTNSLLPPPAYNGNLTIEPNGTIVGTGSGQIPITNIGNNYYTLNENVNGTITILQNGATFNGMDQNVSYNLNANSGVFTIANSTDVSLSNLSVSTDYSSSFGLSVSNSSHISVDNLQITNTSIAARVTGNDHYVNISNSRIYNTSSFSMILGLNYVFPIPIPDTTSSYLVAYNDTFYTPSSLLFGGVFIGAKDSEVSNSNFTLPYSEINIGSVANNTTISGNVFYLGNSFNAISVGTAPGTSSTYNQKITNNRILGTDGSGSAGVAILLQNATGMVSGNSIQINAEHNSYNGIMSQKGILSIENNVINITNGANFTTEPNFGIEFNGTGNQISSNWIDVSGGYTNGIGSEPGELAPFVMLMTLFSMERMPF